SIGYGPEARMVPIWTELMLRGKMVLDCIDKGTALMAVKIENVTVKRAAELLGTSRKNINRLVESGRLPAMRLGLGKHDHYRIRVADLDGLFRPQSEHEDVA